MSLPAAVHLPEARALRFLVEDRQVLPGRFAASVSQRAHSAGRQRLERPGGRCTISGPASRRTRLLHQKTGYPVVKADGDLSRSSRRVL